MLMASVKDAQQRTELSRPVLLALSFSSLSPEREGRTPIYTRYLGIHDASFEGPCSPTLRFSGRGGGLEDKYNCVVIKGFLQVGFCVPSFMAMEPIDGIPSISLRRKKEGPVSYF